MSGVRAMMQFLALLVSYLMLLTASDTALRSLSVCWVYIPCFTKQSFNHLLKFLWEALGPQIKECSSKGPATKFSPAARRSM